MTLNELFAKLAGRINSAPPEPETRTEHLALVKTVLGHLLDRAGGQDGESLEVRREFLNSAIQLNALIGELVEMGALTDPFCEVMHRWSASQATRAAIRLEIDTLDAELRERSK
ncbi:MAG: hypothetical protein LIO54_03510 [Oscillospiraceae bacterium]|nr:hypothetical protein [Oscillospiraceae bacterium]